MGSLQGRHPVAWGNMRPQTTNVIFQRIKFLMLDHLPSRALSLFLSPLGYARAGVPRIEQLHQVSLSVSEGGHCYLKTARAGVRHCCCSASSGTRSPDLIPGTPEQNKNLPATTQAQPNRKAIKVPAWKVSSLERKSRRGVTSPSSCFCRRLCPKHMLRYYAKCTQHQGRQSNFSS